MRQHSGGQHEQCEQGKPGECRAPDRDRQQVDDQYDAVDTDDGQHHQARTLRHRRGELRDVVAASYDQGTQRIHRPPGRQQAGDGGFTRVQRRDRDQKTEQPGHNPYRDGQP